MTAAMLLKGLIIILFLLIFASLLGGAFFLAKDRSEAKRTVYSLTVRVTLSVILFLLLITGFLTGILQPHGLMPAASSGVTLPAGPAAEPSSG